MQIGDQSSQDMSYCLNVQAAGTPTGRNQVTSDSITAEDKVPKQMKLNPSFGPAAWAHEREIRG